MEHDIPFGNSNRENGPTFLDFPLFLGIFQWDEPTKRVSFTAEPEIPKILTKWKAPTDFSLPGGGVCYRHTRAQNAENLPNPRRTGERSLSSFNMASKGNSVFSRIIRRELPATFLHEDDQVNQERCVARTLILHRLHSHL